MDNPKDFQVGDRVIAPTLWEGEAVVTEIHAGDLFPIYVELGAKLWTFTEGGQYGSNHLQPSLFHAGTKITIEEARPKRWPWVNVYERLNGEIITGLTFKTRKEATEMSLPWRGTKYLFTCQLKPEDE